MAKCGVNMTHDELLTKIDASGFVRDKDYVWSLDGPAVKKANAALRAVVQLHRPEEIKLLSGEVEDTYCFECEGLINYPCPTIQAIMDNLK